MRTFWLLLCAWMCFTGLWAQSGSMRFVPVYRNHPLELQRRYYTKDSAWIAVTGLRFYIGNPTVYKAGLGQTDAHYYLIDLEDSNSCMVPLPEIAGDSLTFLIGTDSLTNVSGILEGALDPTLGMYWAWNSGYINFRLQGFCGAAPGAGKPFEYHIGGYLPPFPTVQKVTLPLSGNTLSPEIRVDVAVWLDQIDRTAVPIIMIPGKEAAKLATFLPSLFSVKTP